MAAHQVDYEACRWRLFAFRPTAVARPTCTWFSAAREPGSREVRLRRRPRSFEQQLERDRRVRLTWRNSIFEKCRRYQAATPIREYFTKITLPSISLLLTEHSGRPCCAQFRYHLDLAPMKNTAECTTGSSPPCNAGGVRLPRPRFPQIPLFVPAPACRPGDRNAAAAGTRWRVPDESVRFRQHSRCRLLNRPEAERHRAWRLRRAWFGMNTGQTRIPRKGVVLR